MYIDATSVTINAQPATPVKPTSYTSTTTCDLAAGTITVTAQNIWEYL
jgi:hypothetical protein